MKKKTITLSVKIMIILLAAGGLAVCIAMPKIVGLFEQYIKGFTATFKTVSSIVLIAQSVPCFVALIPAWKIADSISKNKAFSALNCKRLKLIGILMCVDAGFIFALDGGFCSIGMSKIFLSSVFILISFIFTALGICALGLSALTNNAAELQEQSDLTI